MSDRTILCQPIHVSRSDGQNSHPTIGVPVLRGSPRYEDWCRRLGQWLMEGFDLEGRYSGQQFILDELPAGYELREVSRTTGRANPDVYLHGRTSNPAHKYRSIQEFLPHLIWLASDGNKACVCKLCKILDPTPKSQASSIKARAPDGKGAKAKGPTKVDSESPRITPSINKSAPVLSVSSRTNEQILDSEPNGRYLYRPGELSWFKKNDVAWGLAVISNRLFESGKPRYYLQPLSHPLDHPAPEIEDQDQMKPWLAWSVPALVNRKLQNATYDQVPWAEVVEASPHDAVVDGSILAAVAIDASYSLFERDESALSNTGERFYRGLFLGAEKIWTGEPVRLRVPGGETFVLVIKKIVEDPRSPSASGITLCGDIYMLTKMPTPIENRDIPPRMEADLKFRNGVERAVETGLWNDWRIVELNARKGLESITGRWYEAESMLPILRGEEAFKEDLEKRVAGDAGMYMNGRGDLREANVRQKDRRSTFGLAVPPGFKVSRGLDENRPVEVPDFPDSMDVVG